MLIAKTKSLNSNGSITATASHIETKTNPFVTSMEQSTTFPTATSTIADEAPAYIGFIVLGLVLLLIILGAGYLAEKRNRNSQFKLRLPKCLELSSSTHAEVSGGNSVARDFPHVHQKYLDSSEYMSSSSTLVPSSYGNVASAQSLNTLSGSVANRDSGIGSSSTFHVGGRVQDECNHPAFSLASQNKVRVKRASAIIGRNGATVEVGGCRLVFPEGALDREIKINLTATYGDENVNRLTPLLKCEPHGLKFLKDVKVILPTCFRTNGETSVTAVARRSDDEFSWEDIKLFDHRTDRYFTFVIQSFSWYDVVVVPFMKYLHLLREKSVVCGIPDDYSDNPGSMIVVCYIFDSILDANRLNCRKIFTTTMLLRNDESTVKFVLSADDAEIDPDHNIIDDVWSSPEEEAQFRLKKQSTNLIHLRVILNITTSSECRRKSFYIPRATMRPTENNDSAAGLNSTTSLSQVQGVSVGNRNAVTNNYYGTVPRARYLPTSGTSTM